MKVTACYMRANVLSYEKVNKSSSGVGAIPYRRYSPRPAQAAEMVQFHHRQYSLDERREEIVIYALI